MGGFLFIVGFLVLIVGIYVGSYYFNSKTKAPVDAPIVSCETCHSTSCSLRSKIGPKSDEECEYEEK